MTQQSSGDPIRAMADKLREDMDRFKGRTVMATRKQAVKAAALSTRQRGGKTVAVIRGR